jgi:hypothetical protein
MAGSICNCGGCRQLWPAPDPRSRRWWGADAWRRFDNPFDLIGTWQRPPPAWPAPKPSERRATHLCVYPDCDHEYHWRLVP